MVNRTLPYVLDNKALPELSSRSISSSKSKSQKNNKKKISSAGSTKFKVPSIGSKESTSLYNVKPNQGLIDNLYQNLLKAGSVLRERELISPRSPKVRIETEHSNGYGLSSPRTEPLELGVKALNSFVIAAGNIHHGNRLIKYIIREILGTCFSIDLLVPATEQTWTVFVPTTDPIKELMKTWKRRIGTKFEEANHIDKLCTWLLSCLQLHFNSGNMIVSAEFNQEFFKNLYQLEIRTNVNMSVVLIQSHIRRYLSNKHLRESLLRIQKVNDGRVLAMMRARNRKLLKSYDASLNRTSNTTNNYAQALNERTDEPRRGGERSNRKADNQNYLYGNVLEAENQAVGSPYHARPPNSRGGSDGKVRPNFNNSVNSQDEDVEKDNPSFVQSTEKPTQEETFIDGQPYVSYFESNPTRANMITKQTLWTNTIAKTGRSNNVYSSAAENEGSLSNLIRSHNDNALNKPPIRSRNTKTIAMQLMRQEVSLLLSKVELLEQKLNEEREINARNEYYLKEEFSHARKRAAKVAERVALKARQDVIEEVSQKMVELQNDVEKTEREREALMLRELESIKKKWFRRSKTPGTAEKKSEEAVTNPPGEKDLERDSWIDVSLDESKDDELSETSLERRLRLNAATRKVRKETSKRSRKRVAANENSGSIEVSSESLSATNGEQVDAEEDAQSETSLERRLRLNAQTRKARKEKSRRSKKSKEALDSTELSSEDFSTVDRGGEQEEDDEAAQSETSLERRLRLNSDKKKEKKGRRSRKRREDDDTEQTERELALSTAKEFGEGDNVDVVEDSGEKKSERREKDRKSRNRKGRGKNRRIRLNTPELRAKTKSISPIKEVDTDEAPFTDESTNLGLSEDKEIPGQVLTEFSLLTIVSEPSVVEDDQFDAEKIGRRDFVAKKLTAVITTPVASDKAVTFSTAEDNLSPISNTVDLTSPKPITLPAVNTSSSIAISNSNSNGSGEKSASTTVVAEDTVSTLPVKPAPVSLPRHVGRSVSAGVATFHQNPKSPPVESSTSELLAHSVSMKATPTTTPTTSVAKKIFPQSPAPSPKSSLQPKPSEKSSDLSFSSIISAVVKVISRNNSLSSKLDEEKSNDNRSRSSSVDVTKAKDSPATTAAVESDVKEKSGSLRASEFFKKGPSNSAVKRPGTGSRPGSTNRILRPSTADSSAGGADLLLKNVSASKIQRVVRNYARRRKFAKSKNDYSVLRADSLLRIVDSTRDEAILNKAFKTSIELAYLLLANKCVNRSVELYGKYFKSGILYPLNVDLLIECMQFFIKDSKDLVDKGFDALSVVVKLKPNYLSDTHPELCNLIIHTVSNYSNETLLVFKATKCLYRMCDKNESNRLTFGQLEGCLAMKKLLEVHLKNSSLIENLSKCIINMCINCPENQALLGEIGVCDIVFEAFVEYMSVERLFYLLGRTIINLCAGNLRSNQDRMAKGQYPSVFLKAIATYKTLPKAIEQIVTCILSIVANNKVNKTRFQDAGLCEMLMEDVMAQATDVTILSNCFWALSTILTSSGTEEKHKEQHERATALLREFENGKNPNEEVTRQAKIALNRMTRSSSTTGTPVTYVPIKRSNTASAGAMVKL